MDLKTFYKRHQSRRKVRIAVSFLYLLTAAYYLSWRLTVFNADYQVFSVIFFGAELAAVLLASFSFLLQWNATPREDKIAPQGLSVDVLVPTYNERPELVRRTLIAAKYIEYPHETWLLDDGARPEMKALAEELGCHYIAREDNIGAKPGNLNNALKQCTGDFVAVIDCDHIAQRDYLDRLLGHFDDPEIAFVQAPQDYYNVNAFQFKNDDERGLLWHDQSAFFNAAQVGRDYWNSATCCGTSTIVRRSVVDEIGGFPEETLTEDMHLAVKVQKLGYKSAYYPLPLAYGVAPVDLGEYQRQRLRWGQGNVQACREEKLPFTRGLTWIQRLSYSYLGLLYLEGWTRLIFYATPPLILLTGIAPIGYTEAFPVHFIPFALMTWLCFEELGRGNMRIHINEQMAMARFPVFILATFAVFRQRIRWIVSSKEFVGHFQPFLLLPQLAVLVFSVVALVATILRYNTELFATLSLDVIGFVAFWAAINALMAGLVIQNAVRTAANKRPDHRFTLPLPVDIASSDGLTMRGRVKNISATGMSFEIERSAIDKGEAFAGVIYIPALTLPFQARLETPFLVSSREHEKIFVDCLFDWDDATQRDRLDLSLHSCAWHRKLAWDGAFFLTPLERIQSWFSRARASEKLVTNHRTMLYRKHGASSEDEPKFGVIIPSSDPSSTSVTVFEDLPLGSEIEIIWCDDATQVGKIVPLASSLWAGETASAGIDRVLSFSYESNAKHSKKIAIENVPLTASVVGD